MAEKPSKSKLPAYISFSAFISFINTLRETGIPLRIDRSVMLKMSGSQQSAMMASFRFLNLIDDDDKPTPRMKQLVEVADDARGDLFHSITKEAYGFIFSDTEFHLDRATGNQVATKFRSQGIDGSTVTKSISFFLSICQASGIKVSPHVKPPPPPRGATRSTGKANKLIQKSGGEEQEKSKNHAEDFEGKDEGEVERFEIPVPGKASVRVIVPRDLDADDWEMLQNMITVYIKRWKGFKNSGD